MFQPIRSLAAACLAILALATGATAQTSNGDAGIVASPGVSAATSALRLFTVGAGEVTGSYYGAVEAICRAMNRTGPREMRCSAEATQGSIYNLTALREGQIDFALVQSDWQRLAYAGEMQFAPSGPMSDLRSVMALFPETLTVLAVRGRGIDSLESLKGHRVDIGAPASGRRATAIAVLQAMGLKREDFPVILELPIASAYDELCAGRIDASLLVLGHPNATLGDVLERCDLELVPVSGEMRTRIAEHSPDFRTAEIPAGTYPSQPETIPSLAVTATLVTRADQPEDIVAAVVRQTLIALPRLAIENPILSRVTPAAMESEGLVAPLHPGAAAAYASLKGN